jgi:hypothetical protein
MKRARKRKFKEPPLQPLRIPTGWLVEWNTFFDAQPPLDHQNDLSWEFAQDMLLIINNHIGVVIDVDWCPNLKRGVFRLTAVRLYENDDAMSRSWDKPLKHLHTRSKETIVRTLERWMEWYGNQKPMSRKKK